VIVIQLLTNIDLACQIPHLMCLIIVCVCMCVLLEGVVVVGRGTHELQCPGAPGGTILATRYRLSLRM